MTDPHVLLTRADGVLTVELSRRDKKNAITLGMYHGMADALAEARTDAAVRAVLLRGQEDLFTAGNDLGDFLRPEARTERAAPRFLHEIATFPKPIVAAVGGASIGVGTTMLMHCDLVVASAEARFQLPFVSLGLCPEAGSSLLLPQMAGPRLAAELMLLGDFFDAATAQRAGIVNRVVPAAEVLPLGLALAQRLATQPADAMATTKALLRRPPGRTATEAIDEELPHFSRLLGSDEARAIFRAFLERR